MKSTQSNFYKVTFISILFFSHGLCGAQNEKIKIADSLFKAKQYTQSLELYQSVFNEKKYTPSMLLRMAYINEGLGKVGATLYFLKLYNLASDDEQVLKKTEELAAKYKLTGYEESDSDRLQRLLSKNAILIQSILAFTLLSIVTFIFFYRMQNKKSWGLIAAFTVVMVLLLYFNNIYSSETVIVSNDKTYLMDGPSSGANVLAIISEGNLLQLTGRKDVWVRVKWMDKEVYLKEKSVMKVSL
jgi:hypothetical protein